MFLTLVSFLPIILLIFLMTKKKPMPSTKALPLVAFLTYLMVIFVFGHSLRLVHANVITGLLTALTPIMIIWGAIFLFRTMEVSGAMESLRQWLNSVTSNKVAQLMIVGWAFAFLIEGASGFGTPIALAAPVLVGLGFNPIAIAIMVLIMNTVPVSFGAVGTPTWFGFSQINLTNQEIATIGIKTAVIHSFAGLIVPVLALRFVITWEEIRRNIVFIYLSIFSTIVPYVLVALWNYEFPSLVGGVLGLLGSIFFASKGWGLEKSLMENRLNKISGKELIKAGFPLWGTLAFLVITRIPQLGIKDWLNAGQPAGEFFWNGVGVFSISPSLVVTIREILGTEEIWVHKILYVPSLLPFAVVALMTFFFYRVHRQKVMEVFHLSLSQMKAPVLALFGALVFVKFMMMGGEDSGVSRIGTAFAKLTGGAWYGFAAVLGAVGSFFSGSNTISNLMFGPIQNMIALDLNLNKTTVLALQSVGGAMGNMVCVFNIVAVSSVLALKNQDGFIMIRTSRVLIPYAVISALVAVIFFVP